jgi:glycogen debranching enzyme
MERDPPTDQRFTLRRESVPVPAATVTLVEGASFAICDAGGDISPGGVEGVFVGDTRVCSRLTLTVDGAPTEPLTAVTLTPFEAMFVARTIDHGLLVFRELHVSRGLRLDLRVVNVTGEERDLVIDLAVESDLADLFAVKEARAAGGTAACTVHGHGMVFESSDGARGLRVRAGDGAESDPSGRVRWRARIGGREEWDTCVEIAAVRAGEEVSPRFRCGRPPDTALPSARQARWQASVPLLDTDIPHLTPAFRRTAEDLGALRLFDPEHPTEPLVAAGAPWFMTLFGRDSLLTSWMALLIDPRLARSTLAALARLQGRADDDATEEQPGRILHEVRFSAGASLALRDGEVYYGTADATPLFVMLVHELWRWGTPLDDLRALLPAVDAALAWLSGPGDPDRDGYVEYAPRTARSLANQGWKDSFDGVSYADGRFPTGPVALAEVQGYAFAAWRAGAALAAAVGDHVGAAERRARADALQYQFERDFWLPDREAFALALDGDKRPVDAVASNMGHCLWTGIVGDREKAKCVARWLTSPEMFTGWGVRTLASSMARYNPLSYHNGSVWPHDTAICVAGLRRAGFADEALMLASGLFAAAAASGGRLPELFAGLSMAEVPAPVPYPASCSPQAWAAASPLLLVRTLLGFEPDVPGGLVAIDPALPDGARRLALVDVPLGRELVSVEVEGDAVAVRGLPRSVTVVRPGS